MANISDWQNAEWRDGTVTYFDKRVLQKGAVQCSPAPCDHMKPWTQNEVDRLVCYFQEGIAVESLATMFGRTVDSIECRLEKAGVYQRVPLKLKGSNPSTILVDECSSLDTDKSSYPIDTENREVVAGVSLDYSGYNRVTFYHEGVEMSTRNIVETKTFVNGREEGSMSNDELLNVITTAEAEIERLDKVVHKPLYVKERLAELNEGIMLVVNILDKRSEAVKKND